MAWAICASFSISSIRLPDKNGLLGIARGVCALGAIAPLVVLVLVSAVSVCARSALFMFELLLL